MSAEPAARTRVLVVDDSNLMRKAALKMLSAEFDVVTAEDGIDAWAKIERDTSIQVVFSDLSMPRSDGYDLLTKVRNAEDPGVSGLPLIIVTGADNDEAARMKALDMGATDFITKPFTSTDLVARARTHAKYQRITKQLLEQSTLDPLTGLLNKSGFIDRLQQDVAFSHRHSQALTVARLEIDHLRDVFLKHGKGAAEGLVLHVSKLVREKIRTEDSAGRIGLGSFAMAFPAGQHEGVEGMLGRLCKEAAANPFEFDFEVIPIRLAAGVFSPVLQSDTTATGTLEEAQAALDAARAAGRAAPEARPQAPPPPTLPADLVTATPTNVSTPDDMILAAVQAAKAEAAKVEAARAEAAKVEAARVETAKVEAAKVEAAKVEAAKIEAARVEAARVEAARVEAAKVEAARVEAAKAEAARVEAEKVEVAKVAAAKAEAARIEAAKTAIEFPKFPEPVREAASAHLRLDPLLDALDAGNAQPAREKLPQVIERLLPLLNLLAANQRAWLVQWLGRARAKG